jgi:hypothetical protein
MKNIFVLISICCLSSLASGQTKAKTSLYLSTYSDIPIYNLDILNNPIGGGIGIVFLINSKTNFKPKLDLNFNRFLNTHIVYDEPTSKTVIEKGITCLFIGSSYSCGMRFDFSLVAGICFYNSDMSLGLKPSVGLYLDKKQQFMTELSLTNIFKTSSTSDGPFGYLNLGFRVKIY